MQKEKLKLLPAAQSSAVRRASFEMGLKNLRALCLTLCNEWYSVALGPSKVPNNSTKSRDAARPFDPMPPRLRPPGTGTFRLRARPGSARASVSNCPQYVFVLSR